MDELLEDTGEWQTFVSEREYEQTDRIDFRRYQLDLEDDVMEIIGVEIPEDVEVSNINLNAVWAIELLSEIGKTFGDYIDFDDPDGLILLTELDWQRFKQLNFQNQNIILFMLYCVKINSKPIDLGLFCGLDEEIFLVKNDIFHNCPFFYLRLHTGGNGFSRSVASHRHRRDPNC